MEHFVVIVSCPVCGSSHSYSLVEQVVAVRNSALSRRESRPSLQGVPKLPSSGIGQSKVSVSAICPTTGRAIKVSLIQKELTEKGLDPTRVSLALIGSEAKE